MDKLTLIPHPLVLWIAYLVAICFLWLEAAAMNERCQLLTVLVTLATAILAFFYTVAYLEGSSL